MHLALFADMAEIVPGDVSPLIADWDRLLEVRQRVLGSLERARRDELIGKGLDASVDLRADLSYFEVLHRYRHNLPELFNVSQTSLTRVSSLDSVPDPNGIVVTSGNALGARCTRCWRYTHDVGSDIRYPEVCTRCAGALEAIGFAPTAVPEPQGEPA